MSDILFCVSTTFSFHFRYRHDEISKSSGKVSEGSGAVHFVPLARQRHALTGHDRYGRRHLRVVSGLYTSYMQAMIASILCIYGYVFSPSPDSSLLPPLSSLTGNIMLQTHPTPNYLVQYRPIKWSGPNHSGARDLQAYQVSPHANRASLKYQYFGAARSTILENTRHTEMETQRIDSSPVSPTTITQSAQHTTQSTPRISWSHHPKYYPHKETCASDRSGIHEYTNTSTPKSPSQGWRPFHVFSTGPKVSLLGERNPLFHTHESASKRIVACQENLFRDIENICTNAAKKYWDNQSSSTFSLPSILHRCTSAFNQRSHQDVRDCTGQSQQHRHGDRRDVSLMEYILRINDILLRRAKLIQGDSGAATAESLARMMKLLTWAEQVRNLAERGGDGMSDDDIEEAVKGARDLICWLLDLEGEMEFDKLWHGKWVDGGLVLCEEDVCTLGN